MFYALTNDDIKNLRNRSEENGWEQLPMQGANNRAYYRMSGNTIQLKSYDTIVFEYDTDTNEFTRKWSGYSATTLKHVQMFVCWIKNEHYYKNSTFGKANWEAMEVA